MNLEEITVYLFFVSNLLGLFVVFFGQRNDAVIF